MKHITVIGAGAAGLSLVETIRAQNESVPITLIDKNTHSFNKPKLIRSLSSRPWIDIASWARERGVSFIQGEVERISTRRRKIYFKQKGTYEFGELIVATGLISKKMTVKGAHREGFFYLSGMDTLALGDILKVSSEVSVYTTTILGFFLALSLSAIGKEVRLISNDFDFVGEGKEKILDFFRQKKCTLYSSAAIEEAIGEGMVKAVKLIPLKVVSSQMLFVDSGFFPNRDFFEEPVICRDTFFTNIDGVYLLGDVTRDDVEQECFFLFNYAEAKTQGEALANFLQGGEFPFYQKRSASQEEKQRVISQLIEAPSAQR